MTRHYSHRPSRLLTEYQNRQILGYLRKNCTSLVTTAAIIHTYSDKEKRWVYNAFGFLCIVLDTRCKEYFLQFYPMNDITLVFERKITKYLGTPFSLTGHLFLQIQLNKMHIAFEFVNSRAGLEEFSLVTKALRGNLRLLELEAEERWYDEHPQCTSLEEESRFKMFFNRKNKESKPKLSPSDGKAEENPKFALPYWAKVPLVGSILNHLGIDPEDVYKNKDCIKEVDKVIVNYDGVPNLTQVAIQSGFDPLVGESLADSPISVTLTSPEGSTQPLATTASSPLGSSMSKTVPKNVIDMFTGSKRKQFLQVPVENEHLKIFAQLLKEDEDAASEATPEKDASTSSPKPSTTTGEAASSSPTKPGTPEKVAEPAAKEKVGKLVFGNTFFSDLNMLGQRLYENIRKYKAEKKLKKEQKLKNGQPVATTPEQTPEKEAPMQTEKAPVKEASKTPEKNPSSVSDTTDETETDSDR